MGRDLSARMCRHCKHLEAENFEKQGKRFWVQVGWELRFPFSSLHICSPFSQEYVFPGHWSGDNWRPLSLGLKETRKGSVSVDWLRSPVASRFQQESLWASVKGPKVPHRGKVTLLLVLPSCVYWSMLHYLWLHNRLPQTLVALNSQHLLSHVVFVGQNPSRLAGCFWCGSLVRCPSVTLCLSRVPSREQRLVTGEGVSEICWDSCSSDWAGRRGQAPMCQAGKQLD